MSTQDSKILYFAAVLITLSVIGLIVVAIIGFTGWGADPEPTNTIKTCVTVNQTPLTVKCTTIHVKAN